MLKLVKEFLKKKKKKQRKELDTLKMYIRELTAKAEGIEKLLEKKPESSREEKLRKDYNAVMKLLKKTKKRYVKLLKTK